MKIEITEFKGVEGITLENSKLKVLIVPKIGGKIASIYNIEKDFELLFQNKKEAYDIPRIYGNFEDFDAAGFDDAFPTIDEDMVNVGNSQITYPDHGEIWSAEFNYEIKDTEVILSYKSELLNYLYKKYITLDDNTVKVRYDIENLGVEKLPTIWAAHYLVNCHEDMEIIFPKGCTEVVNVQRSNKLGDVNTIHSYPITMDFCGKEYNLSKVLKKECNHTEKYYAKEKVEEGICGIYYPHKDIRYTLKYNKDVLPYLGFWVTEGGFRGDYNCALEPSNGYYDSITIAEENKALCYLEKGKKLEFNIDIELK